MLYIKWLLLTPVSLVMAVVGRVLAPVLPFFVQDDGYLPRWLWWFQTPDNPCDGDKGHWERWPDTSAWGTYKRRVAWFLRNVAYGFDIGVLGQKTIPGDCLDMDGQEGVSDQPYGKSATGLNASIAAKSWFVGTPISSGSGASGRKSAFASRWGGSFLALTARKRKFIS